MAPSPIKAFADSIDPVKANRPPAALLKPAAQTPEEFNAMATQYQQYQSGNQHAVDYFGGGWQGFVRGNLNFMKALPGFGPVADVADRAVLLATGAVGDVDYAKADDDAFLGGALKPIETAMMGLEASYGVMNTAGTTLGLLVNAPAIASGISKPGENMKSNPFLSGIPGGAFLTGGVGNLGGNELNPYLRDGFQFNDLSATWDQAWNNDITIGQTGMLQVGRTLNQPFWDEEGDLKIIQESQKELDNPANERMLYASNIGLSSEFDITDKRQLDSATNQGYGRWISGGIDAAAAWFIGPDVLFAKGVGKGMQKMTTTFLTSQGNREIFRAQYYAGKRFAETGGSSGRRTAAYELAEYISKTPKTYLAQHDIARLSTEPSLIAEVLGAAKTPDEAIDAILALAGDKQAISNIAERIGAETMNFNGKQSTVLDALTAAGRRQKQLAEEMDIAIQQRANMGGATGNKALTPLFDNHIAKLNEEMDQLQKVVDEAADILKPYEGIRTAVDFGTQSAKNVRISKINTSHIGSVGVGKVGRQANKAVKRAERITGDNLWRSETFKAGGKFGRTIRVIHAGVNYAGTTKIRGLARVSDAKDSMEEMKSLVTTNPTLRKFSTRIGENLDESNSIHSDWLPTAKKKIEDLKDTMSPEKWDEFVADGSFDSWAVKNKVRTATGTREYFYNRMLNARSEIERYEIFDAFEEQMFMEMAADYGMSADDAFKVLEQYSKMRNQVSEQISQRGWYWDKATDEIHVSRQLQSELAEGKPLLDFNFMERIFKINSGGLTGTRVKLGVSLSAFLSTLDAIWRPLVLMRLGYTLRNVAESNLRELAYTSQIPGVSNFSGAARSSDMRVVDFFSNATNRLSEARNFAVHGPLRYGTKGTKKALRKSFDAESAVLQQRRAVATATRAEFEASNAEREALIAQARRDAAVQVARSAAKDKVPGENVVWEQILDGVSRRKEFFETVDEIIIDPIHVDGLGRGEFGVGVFAEDAPVNNGMSVTDAMYGPDGASLRKYLSREERDRIESTIDDLDLSYATKRVTALDNWITQTGGNEGVTVRLIDPSIGHYEIIHQPKQWFDEQIAAGVNPSDALDQLRVVQGKNMDNIQGGRVQVGGGVVDLRPNNFGDQWSSVHLDPSVHWDETWQRVWKFSDYLAGDPSSWFYKVRPITDPLGGAGKYENAVGYVKVDALMRGMNPNQKFDDLFEWSDDALGEWTTPIVAEMHGTDVKFFKISDGQKRLMSAANAGKGNAYVPVVVKRGPADRPVNESGFGTLGPYVSNGKLSYLEYGLMDEVDEWDRLGAHFFNPRHFTAFEYSTWKPTPSVRRQFDSLPSSPAWQSFAKFMSPNKDVDSAMYVVDLARAAKAAETNPIIRKQLEIRLGDVTDAGVVGWAAGKGHIMPDDELRQLIDEAVPLNGDVGPDEITSYIASLKEYQGTQYEDLNEGLWDSGEISNEYLTRALDWSTTQTHVVEGTRPMRIYRNSAFELEEGYVPAFTSSTQNPFGISVTGSTWRYAFDVEPGVPYASFERLVGSNWEQEILLPRGIEVRRVGYINEGYGERELFTVSYDADAAANTAIYSAAFKPSPPNASGFPQPALGERIQGQLGGYTYGKNSGVWLSEDGTTQFYVKDYNNPAQGFLEFWIDSNFAQPLYQTRSSTMGFIPNEGFAYSSQMQDMTNWETIGQAIRRGLTDDEQIAIEQIVFSSLAEDTLLMNFDSLGPALENMWVNVTDFPSWSNKTVGKFDNGASAMFRAHGEVAPWKKADIPFDSILQNADNNGYGELFRAVYRKEINQYDSDTLASWLVNRINDEVNYYGTPGARFKAFFDEYRNTVTTDRAVFLDDMEESVNEIAQLLNDRSANILEQIVAQGSVGSAKKVLTRFRNRLQEEEGGRVIGPPARMIPGETRPAAQILKALDRPDVITESGTWANLAKEYAKEKGIGKIITPNPSGGRGYQIYVNPDRVYEGGANIDSTYPGWLSSAAKDSDTVLDLSRSSFDEVFQTTGMDAVSATKALQSGSIPHSAKTALAIRMENEGWQYIILPNGRKYSQSELIGTADDGAAYGAAIAPDLVEARAQAALAKSDRYAALNINIREQESALRRLEGKVVEREASVEKARTRLENRLTTRTKASGTTYTGGQLNETINYVVKGADGSYTQKSTDIPSTFGEQASLWKQLISSNDRVNADILGLTELTFQGMRRSAQTQVHQPWTDGYWRALADYGERNYSNDVIGQAVLEGKSDDEIIEIMFGTDRGRSAIRKMDDFKDFRGLVSKEALGEGLRDDMVRIISDRRQVLDEFYPDDQVRQILIDPTKSLNADTLRLRLGPRSDLKPFEGVKFEVEQSLGRRGITSVMHAIGTLPEDKLARSPFFRNRYRESMKSQIDTAAEQGVEEFSMDVLQQMARIARKEALQQLNDTLYTIQRVSTFANSVRLVVPFFPAWASSAKFWLYQVPKTKPENLVRYMQVDSAADRAGWTVDEDNKRVDGPSSAPFAFVRKMTTGNAASIAFQIAPGDSAWFDKVVGPMNSMKLPKGSVDMMLQGEYPVLFTTSPIVTVPVSWVAAMRPDITSMITEKGDFKFTIGDDEEMILAEGTLGEALASRVIPFGRPTESKDFVDAVTDAYAPTWLNKLLVGARGESSAQFVSLAQEIHRSNMTDWEVNDRVGDEPKYSNAVQQARDFQVFRATVSATAPFSPQFQSKYQFYIDSWRSIQDEGYDNGLTLDEMEYMFIQRYGTEFFRYTRSKSSNQSGMGSDIGEYEAVTKYEELTGKLANYGPNAKFINMLTKSFNTGSDFNPNVYAWQMDRPIPGAPGRYFRGGGQQSMVEEDSRIELGWKFYNSEVTKLEILAEQRGLDKDVLDRAKRKLVGNMASKEEYQGWYTEFQEISGGRWVDSVNALYDMVGDEDLMKDFGPPEDTEYVDMNRQQQYFYVIDQFIEIRDWTILKLEQSYNAGGSANIDAKQNAALKKVVDQRIMDLGDINPDFRDMHRRFFGGDKYVRTQDNTMMEAAANG